VTGEHSAALAESDACHQNSPRTIFESAPWRSLVLLPVLLISACGAARKPTVSDAQKFMDTVESRLLTLGVEAQRADWVRSTYITGDTEILSAQADQKAIEAQVAFVKEAQQFSGLTLPPALARKFYLLKTSLTLATPSDPAKSAELTRIVSNMESSYGKGKYCKSDGKCFTVEDLSRLMANSRNRAELLDAWRGWHTISPPLRQPFVRYVQLANEGARQLGFADAGALWRARYDMSPDAFQAELDRLWTQVRPLYMALHTYVRKRLREQYGANVVPAHGPIPADLLGNMWAQDWSNIYPLVAPPNAGPGYDLTAILKQRHTEPLQMIHYGENFFKSLGFAPLPQTFWERSLFVKPRDREVVCHASAWDVDTKDDVRLKMCVEITAEDFRVAHHELGHNFYQRAYNNQPLLFRDGANDGFHEAIGDTIALSITPQYLVRLGFLKQAPDASRDTGLLLERALEKVAFLPFGLLIDKWRWEVFAGQITPEEYNKAWWQLRLKYQGIAPPLGRSEADFDPGAKYHVAANVPYARYFLADILQFQFHRALAKIAGCTQPLEQCSIYGNKEAGERFAQMLALGESKPWPEALNMLTGEKDMDATALVDYFAPLKTWLDEQNRGEQPGW
jgi:peptidyl-dipeptidase A